VAPPSLPPLPGVGFYTEKEGGREEGRGEIFDRPTDQTRPDQTRPDQTDRFE